MADPKKPTDQAEGKNDLSTYLRNNPEVARNCRNAVAQWSEDIKAGKGAADMPPESVLVCSLGGGDAKPRGKGR